MSETILVRDTIHSAHRIRGYRGDCRFVHGASWQGAIRISCDRFPRDEHGRALDPDRLLGILRRFDHRLIDATAENLAATLVRDAARYIRATFPDRAMRYTIGVRIAESDDDIFSMTCVEVIGHG
jgi:6-pyruvoyl-tetrahydropterin synthase